MSLERRALIARTALEDVRDYLDAPGMGVIERLDRILEVVADAQDRIYKDEHRELFKDKPDPAV